MSGPKLGSETPSSRRLFSPDLDPSSFAVLLAAAVEDRSEVLSMLDIDTEEELIVKIGGKFRLTSLIQKRMVELHRPGARALVKIEDKRDLLRVVIQEVLQDKIQLAPREEVSYSLEEEKLLIDQEHRQQKRVPEEEDESASTPAIYGSDIKKIKEQRIRELAELLNPNKK